jgi:hypothetical protein
VANYVKTVWVDGVTPQSAANENAQEQGIYDAHFQPAALASHGSAQAIADATPTTLAFGAESYDQDGLGTSTIHDNSTNNSRLTCRVAWIYHVWWSFDFAPDATGYRYASVLKNGSLVRLLWVAPLGGGAQTPMEGERTIALAVNDYVQVQAYQGSGGSLNVEAGASFGMFRVG